MKFTKEKLLKLNRRHFIAIALAGIMTLTTLIPGTGFMSAQATISTPQEINDLGYLGRGVNLLRDIDVNDKSDDLLSQNHLKAVLTDNNLSDFTVSKDYISTSYGQGFTSKSFASLAMSMGVDLSTKASASSDFVIGSAKMEAGFSMSMKASSSVKGELEFTIYNYQKYLDTWTLNWDNGGIKGSASALRDNLDINVYGALTDSFPQYTWSPKDFFEEYGTHIIVSYKRGGEYTYSSIEEAVEVETSLETSVSVEASGSASVSSFGSASFSEKVESGFTVDSKAGEKFRMTTTFSRGSSKGQINTADANSVNTWDDGVDDKNAQVLSSGLTLIAMWDLLPSQYADRKAELKNYYNEQVAGKCNDLLNKFVYKTVNEGDFDFSQYDAVISSAGELDKIRNNLNGKYILACDIDLDQYSNWQPIGTKRGNDFTGILDGNGNTISNLTITDCNEPYIGLFGYNSGTIKNLSVNGIISLANSSFDISGSNKPSIGGIVGYNCGTIENCQSEVNINSTIGLIDSGTNSSVQIDDEIEINTEEIFKEVNVIKVVSIENIPDSINDTTVFDLTEFAGTINKTITLMAGAKGVRFIGNPNKEYIGLELNILNSQFDRFIVLENMNWNYSSNNGAIHSNANTKVWLISEGEKNKISSSVSDISTAISIDNDLILAGDADLSIVGSSGGNGASGTNGNNQGKGSSGKNGGTTIITNSLTVNLNAKIEIIGGIGGTGGTGVTGTTGSKGGNASGFFDYNGKDGGKGGTGGAGGSGGTGGTALQTDSITVFNGYIVINGGAGGAGGAGGKGGTGGAGGSGALWGSNGKQGVGGTGGAGGNGGNFGNAIVKLNDSAVEISVLNDSQLILSDNDVGAGGKGGAGGSGRSSGASGETGSTVVVPNTAVRVSYYNSAMLYSLYDATVTYNEAYDLVSGSGNGKVKLVSIYDNDEQEIINSLFNYHSVAENKLFWIGAERGEGRVEDNIDKWTWQRGGTFEYDYVDKNYKNTVDWTEAFTNWGEGEPTSETGENYLAINSFGFWSANFSSITGGYITKESRNSGIGNSNLNVHIGGIVGYNEYLINYVRNDSDINVTIKSKDDFAGVISGISGANNGIITQVLNQGNITVKVSPDGNHNLNSNILMRKITYNVLDGELNGYQNKTDNVGVFQSEEGYTIQLPDNDWNKNNANNDDKYDDSWESIGYKNIIWSNDRVHINSVDKTEFLQNEVLSNNIIELTYEDEKGVHSSYMYSYKYDFSKVGVTAIKISYSYGGNTYNKYIPVFVADIVTVEVDIDKNESILEYQYGDEFVLPIIKITKSDGTTESCTAKLEDILNIPIMTEYGFHNIKVRYESKELEYDIFIAQKEVAATVEQLKIKHRTAEAGKKVTVQFAFANMPEFKSVLLHNFIYDKTKLEILKGEWTVEGELKDWDPNDEIATFTNNSNQDYNLSMFELTFFVKEDCPADDYTVSCSALVNAIDEFGYENSILFDVSPGSVNVIDVPRGDFNRDKVVTEDDAIYLLRYTLFGGTAFEITQSGDVNGDDIVNSDDAIYLLRYTLLPEENPLYW